jgi:hypothetical protein
VEANETNSALDATVASLQGGVEQLGIETALPIIQGWEQRLATSGSPELALIAKNLGTLRGLLSADDVDPAAVGRLLVTLGEQVQRVANDEHVEIEVADRLSQLSVLLSSEGESISGEGTSGF